jgi:hypothetical protein
MKVAQDLPNLWSLLRHGLITALKTTKHANPHKNPNFDAPPGSCMWGLGPAHCYVSLSELNRQYMVLTQLYLTVGDLVSLSDFYETR